ncbi:MAG TPA: FAD-dependent oxidoreductase [Bacillales bacterium]|nr:FAD-dependent oxidoreductase [Bacillales bacterium]
MSKYHVKLLKKETIANETMAFHWEKPEDFEFKAGQFCDMTLIDPDQTDEDGNVRTFSLAHAPYEKDLVTATRMRDSAFKRELKDLPEGTEVKLDDPLGDFTLHKTETTPAVFLIGGIGITPVRSIIAQATHDQMPHDITLLYSNKTPEDAAFLPDLEGFAKENSHFTFVPTMTDADANEWDGESGYIDEAMLRKYVSDLNAPRYYLSGPADMVRDMHKMLVQAGVNEDNVKAEEFSGY